MLRPHLAEKTRISDDDLLSQGSAGSLVAFAPGLLWNFRFASALNT